MKEAALISCPVTGTQTQHPQFKEELSFGSGVQGVQSMIGWIQIETQWQIKKAKQSCLDQAARKESRGPALERKGARDICST